MKLRDIAIAEVSGVLEQAIGSSTRPAQRRAGLVIKLTDSDGNVGLGEASPLPGFSPDSLESCRAALGRLEPGALAACLTGTGRLLDRLVQVRALLPAGSPAAVFALETALLDLACRREQRSPFELLEHTPLVRLELNAVLDGTLPDALDRARALVRGGYSTLKLKLGARWEPALDTLTELSAAGGLKLRADANRSLPASDLERALPRLAALGLEFLEEPCAPESWPTLPRERPPLALDESLAGATSAALPALLRASGAQVVVLKPMALGGFCECLGLAQAARACGCDVVVTHLFDGPIALRAAGVLGLMIQSPGLAAGVAPHAGLAAWPPPLELGAAHDPDAAVEPALFHAGISPAGYWEHLGA